MWEEKVFHLKMQNILELWLKRFIKSSFEMKEARQK